MPALSSIGGTALSLTAAVATPTKGPGGGCLVKAAAANGGKVYVGYANTVTAGTADATDGIELAASESLFVPAGLILQDLQNVWVIASTTGQKVFYQTM